MFFKFLVIGILATCTVALDYDCPATGQHFFRYPYDCSKFIECHDGVSRLIDCITGLQFSFEKSYCDFPENAKCIQEDPKENPKCPELNGDFATYLPHETDCTKFYECVWGRPILMSCPPTLFFNTKLNVCDFQEASGCVQK